MVFRIRSARCAGGWGAPALRKPPLLTRTNADTHLRSAWCERISLKRVSILLIVAFLTGWNATCRAENDDEFFEKRVRPILVSRCESCHSAAKGKTHGGLALDSRQGWQKGGETGTPIVPGKTDESLLIKAIRYRDDGLQMPPKDAGGKLPDAEIALLTEWVSRGASDPRGTTAKRGNMTERELREWWSFQPIKPVAPVGSLPGSHNEIDSFIRSPLAEAGLIPSPASDRRTLIRRATYDLTGLPPTPEEVDHFVADTAPLAYENLIDRLLQSPRYGERWGRHWLDLVRYADTAGENTDHPIPDAWRYRNWVIESFNRDLPYDQFIREQVAGDLLHANDPADKYAKGVISTGFLAIARRFDHDSDRHMHLTFEDTIDTMGKTVLGLSIACARCHDHKYDPISANDYYALYGILNSTRFAFPGCEAKQQPRDLIPLLPPAEWAKTIEPYDRAVAAIDAELKQLADSQVAHVNEFKVLAANSGQMLARGEIPDGGNQIFKDASDQKLDSVDVKVGEFLQLTIDHAGNYGADTTLIEWEITEIGGENRKWNLTQDVVGDFLAGNPHADRLGNAATWMFLDGRGGPTLLSEAVRDSTGKAGLHVWRSGDNPAVFVNSNNEPLAVWTTLPPRTLFVHPAPDGPVALGWVSPFNGKIEIRGRIVDAHPGGPNGVTWKIDHSRNDYSASLKQMAAVNVTRTAVLARRATLVANAPVREFAYAVTEGTVANAKMHLRGDPEKLGDEIPRRWLDLFGGQPLPPDAGSGRLQLADWLVSPANPLTPRVMANRIWQHHFGKGLVQTPNDFGTRGQRPTHPELLDWLAGRFVESGWSIKAMHRLIMLSDTYRQSVGDPTSAAQAKAFAADPNNNLCWRFDRQRLSAEELRDSLLFASQQLDLTPGRSHPIPPTPGWSFSQHVPFAGVAETNQRSIYQMTLRNRRHPFMALFDGADPNATTPQRQVTTVPTQSLYFLNDAFFHGQAERVAKRILSDKPNGDSVVLPIADASGPAGSATGKPEAHPALPNKGVRPHAKGDDTDTKHNGEGVRPLYWAKPGDPTDDARLYALYRIVLQRTPTPLERESAVTFLAKYRSAIAEMPENERPLALWSAYTRILLASNEFLFLD